MLRVQPAPSDLNKHMRKRSANEPDEGGAAKRSDDKVCIQIFFDRFLLFLNILFWW